MVSKSGSGTWFPTGFLEHLVFIFLYIYNIYIYIYIHIYTGPFKRLLGDFYDPLRGDPAGGTTFLNPGRL